MNAYRRSTAVALLQAAKDAGQPLRLAFLDIDGTWAGSPEEQQTVRDLLEENRYVVAAVTSRLPDMSLSRTRREAADAAALQGLLDPDIIVGATGTEILIKQAAGDYELDESYWPRLPPSPEEWYRQVDNLLTQPQYRDFSFRAQRLAPPGVRVEVVLPDQPSAVRLRELLQADNTASPFFIDREKSHLFITPARMSKADGVDHVISTLCELLNLKAKSLITLFSGDAALDAAMGFFAGEATQGVFIIPGGASLYQELKEPALAYLQRQLTKEGKRDTLSRGVYRLTPKPRWVILGDEAFPGTYGPQTLIAWLRQAHQ
jgi:hypothetical protein